jgi:hypothetical protein
MQFEVSSIEILKTQTHQIMSYPGFLGGRLRKREYPPADYIITASRQGEKHLDSRLHGNDMFDYRDSTTIPRRLTPKPQ